MREYGVNLYQINDVVDADCIIMAVAHNEFKKLTTEDIKRMYRNDIKDEEKVFVDVKGVFSVSSLAESGMRWWRL